MNELKDWLLKGGMAYLLWVTGFLGIALILVYDWMIGKQFGLGWMQWVALIPFVQNIVAGCMFWDYTSDFREV